jgi:hypothetical protein
MLAMQQSNMPVESQKGHAPEPGPRRSIQPILSSALFHINAAEQSARKIAIQSSAVLTVITSPSNKNSAKKT